MKLSGRNTTPVNVPGVAKQLPSYSAMLSSLSTYQQGGTRLRAKSNGRFRLLKAAGLLESAQLLYQAMADEGFQEEV